MYPVHPPGPCLHALTAEAQQVAHTGQHERAFRVVGHGEHRRVVDGAVEGAAVLGDQQATARPSEPKSFTVVFDDVPRAFVEAVDVDLLSRRIVQPESGFEEVEVLDVVDRGGQQVITDHALQVSTAFEGMRPAFFPGGEVKHDH